jgi:hypothetical protein
VAVSFFGGSNFTRDHLLETSHSSWTGEGGATLGWQGSSTSLQVSGIRDVSDGGGLTGAVRRYAVNAGMQRRLTTRWSGTVSFEYSHNQTLYSSASPAFYSIVGLAGVQRTIGRSVSVECSYGRDHQSFTHAAGAFSQIPADHNRVFVSVSYHFTRPLGF